MTYSNKLIYGKNQMENIVACEPIVSGLLLFREVDGKVVSETIENQYWILTNRLLNNKQFELEGSQYYKYLRLYDSWEDKEAGRKVLRKNNIDNYHIYDPKEASLLFNGLTYYKGMKPKDVSILSFDIESTGLVHNADSRVLLISNTYRNKAGRIEKRLFAYDEFESDKALFDGWSDWVRSLDPSIICGHNIFGYDLPYMAYCAANAGTSLKLGRDGSDLRFNDYSSKKRKDGSQDIEYFNAHIYGREIVDTMFLAITYDVGRKYTSYRLKGIIAEEGLEKPDRVFYDADKIRDNYKIPEEWEKIKAYAIDDADDALALFDLMIPAYFYFAQSVSKTFQQMINSATGSQINNIMVRAYLQDGHSIARADEAEKYPGAISFGVPGLYSNCFKQDVASLYPSIMRQYEIYNPRKDPKRYFLEMVEFFTLQRLRNKALAKETGNRSYKDLEQSQKIAINSAYGFLGSSGLNYNYPRGAAKITEYGRNILSKAIEYSTGKKIEFWLEKAGIVEEENE